MSNCADCGERYASKILEYDEYLCTKCFEKREQNRIIENSKSVSKPSDFKQWDSGDMSELFWIHLGRYIKEPNPESLTMMNLAFTWACHDSHGLSNSFLHALEWAKIDLHTEFLRWRK